MGLGDLGAKPASLPAGPPRLHEGHRGQGESQDQDQQKVLPAGQGQGDQGETAGQTGKDDRLRHKAATGSERQGRGRLRHYRISVRRIIHQAGRV